jgi:pyrimidine deaminase RibD-like protein
VVDRAGDEGLLFNYLTHKADLFQNKALGCTAYVTLEPCCHKLGSDNTGGGNTKKSTPPCAEALVTRKRKKTAKNIHVA